MPAGVPDPDAKLNPVTHLLIQPALPSVVDAEFTLKLTLPSLDDPFIDDVVGSRARQRLLMIINHHRELWNRCCAGAVEQYRRQQVVARLQLPFLAGQVWFYRAVYLLTPNWEYFAGWPTWSKWFFLFLQAVGWVMLFASGVGVFTLLRNTATLADSPVACAVVATVVAGCVFGIKGSLAAIESELWRRRFRKGLGAVTVILTWVFFVPLAFLTGGLGASVVSVQELSQNGTADSFGWLSPHVQYLQLLLENTVALATFFFSDLYVEKHGPPNRTPNPVKRFRSQQRNAAAEACQRTHQSLAQARGIRRQLLADRKTFVLQAIARFERKAELARRQEEGLRRQRGESVPEPRRDLTRRFRDFFRN